MYRFTFTLLVVFSSFFTVGQELNLDNYKYIIVADKFHFVKEVDGYQTSSLTKFLLEKKGFQVFVSNENFPEDLSQDKCKNALFADVKDQSDFLTTKSIIVLNDCKGNAIYTSKVGRSKLKEYKKAYHESIRNAFNTMTDVRYSYKPSEKIEPKVNISNDLSNKIKISKDSVIEKEIESKEILNSEILYAQPILNGFQLVNSIPKVVMVIQKTTLKDLFLVKDSQGIVYKEGNDWFFEYYVDNQIVKKQLQIKF
ncbi:hypothetical protein [Polaribacter sp.]|uniref:hypothetical protein n=1 Tax=Polaribacter sp. TaxID=1920175 RepID=UPI0040485B5E